MASKRKERKSKRVPAAVHSELTEYTSLLRSIRTTQTLNVTSQLDPEATQDDDARDVWTRWPLPEGDLPRPEWSLQDEIQSFMSNISASNRLDPGLDTQDIEISAMNHLHHILASLAAYLPLRHPSLQNRLNPMDWTSVLDAVCNSVHLGISTE